MGRWKALGPIFLAMVIAAVGSYFIYTWMQQHTKSPRMSEAVASSKSELIPVAVAAVDLIPGTKLTSELIKTTEFLKNSLPPGHFTDPAALVGRVAIVPLKANEPIIEHRLASVDIKTGGVSALVQEGKRAVAVGGDKVIGLSGFIYPGNRVDVMVTWEDPKTESEITKVVLENMLVMASGTMMQKNDKGDAAPVDVYTLEMTPEEAEIISLVRNQGKIQFALRNPMDSGSIMTKGATYDSAMTHLLAKSGFQKPIMPVELLEKPKPPVRYNRPVPVKPKITVEVISEGQLTQKQF
ncbi:MAG: Flp pilus assembly protein CpaB [Desulfatirhabdiaceae bacterium]